MFIRTKGTIFFMRTLHPIQFVDFYERKKNWKLQTRLEGLKRTAYYYILFIGKAKLRPFRSCTYCQFTIICTHLVIFLTHYVNQTSYICVIRVVNEICRVFFSFPNRKILVSASFLLSNVDRWENDRSE